MVYISSDGTVGGKKTIWTTISEFVSDIFSLIGLFFTTVNNPRALEGQRRRSNNTLAQSSVSRPGSGSTGSSQQPPARRGANIRGVKNLGSTANCAVAGG